VHRPEAETVATAWSDESHVTWAVTTCEVPFEKLAVAVNCVVCPADAIDKLPETVIDVSVACCVGAEGLEEPPPHAARKTQIRRADIGSKAALRGALVPSRRAAEDGRMMTLPESGGTPLVSCQ